MLAAGCGNTACGKVQARVRGEKCVHSPGIRGSLAARKGSQRQRAGHRLREETVISPADGWVANALRAADAARKSAPHRLRAARAPWWRRARFRGAARREAWVAARARLFPSTPPGSEWTAIPVAAGRAAPAGLHVLSQPPPAYNEHQTSHGEGHAAA